MPGQIIVKAFHAAVIRLFALSTLHEQATDFAIMYSASMAPIFRETVMNKSIDIQTGLLCLDPGSLHAVIFELPGRRRLYHDADRRKDEALSSERQSIGHE
jgi:hypothetical protein